MGPFSKVLLAIDKVHTVSERALEQMNYTLSATHVLHLYFYTCAGYIPVLYMQFYICNKYVGYILRLALHG